MGMGADEKSELETLKAQLRESQQQVEQLCGDCKTIQRDYTDAHQAQLRSEAQVRELRELLQKIAINTQAGLHIASALRSAPPGPHDAYCGCVDCISEHAEDIGKTLDGDIPAPPSGQTLGITKRDPLPELKNLTLEGLVKAHRESTKWDKCCCGHYRHEHGRLGNCALCPDEASCDQFDKIDAGEERQDLAKVPAGKVDGGSSGVGSLGSQGVTKMPVTMEIGQRLTERSDDSSDSTHANRLKTTDSKESGVNANQDAQSGPQDSPSRSHSEQLAKEIYALVKDVDTMRLVELYGLAKGREFAQDILNVTPTRSFAIEQSEWISVETKLPGKNAYVLVFAPDYGATLAECTTTTYYDSDGAHGWSIEHECGEDGRVTHWQNLPAPPSPAREKEKAE